MGAPDIFDCCVIEVFLGHALEAIGDDVSFEQILKQLRSMRPSLTYDAIHIFRVLQGMDRVIKTRQGYRLIPQVPVPEC